MREGEFPGLRKYIPLGVRGKKSVVPRMMGGRKKLVAEEEVNCTYSGNFSD